MIRQSRMLYDDELDAALYAINYTLKRKTVGNRRRHDALKSAQALLESPTVYGDRIKCDGHKDWEEG